ncbi:MAG: amino acid ABC transporter permease [Pseudomonadota bacterium]
MRDLFAETLGRPFGIVLFQLLEATQFTLYLTAIAFIAGGAVGMGVTLARIAPNRWARRLSISYIWLFQSTPLLMLLFLTGLGAPRFLGVNIDPWIAASVSLTLYASAYLADVWRGALESIPKGQWEGAFAVGLRFVPALWRVVLPQAIRIALAPTVGFMVQIVKGTSLAYIIGFHDLMSIGKRWANAPVDGTEPFIIFPLMALIYFAICFPLSLASRALERRLGTVSRTPLATA